MPISFQFDLLCRLYYKFTLKSDGERMLNISLTTLRICCDEYRGRPTLLAYGGQLPVFFAAMYKQCAVLVQVHL